MAVLTVSDDAHECLGKSRVTQILCKHTDLWELARLVYLCPYHFTLNLTRMISDGRKIVGAINHHSIPVSVRYRTILSLNLMKGTANNHIIPEKVEISVIRFTIIAFLDSIFDMTVLG
jgi:hypothetical protein